MAENTDPTVVAEDTAVEDDGLYRYVDSEGRKRATAKGSREHLEQLKALAALEKAERVEEERAEREREALEAAVASAESEAKADAKTDKPFDNGGEFPGGQVAPVPSNPAQTQPKVAKATPVKADPKA